MIMQLYGKSSLRNPYVHFEHLDESRGWDLLLVVGPAALHVGGGSLGKMYLHMYIYIYV